MLFHFIVSLSRSVCVYCAAIYAKMKHTYKHSMTFLNEQTCKVFNEMLTKKYFDAYLKCSTSFRVNIFQCVSFTVIASIHCYMVHKKKVFTLSISLSISFFALLLCDFNFSCFHSHLFTFYRFNVHTHGIQFDVRRDNVIYCAYEIIWSK